MKAALKINTKHDNKIQLFDQKKKSRRVRQLANAIVELDRNIKEINLKKPILKRLLPS